MQKKAISILLVLVLVFSLLPAGAIAAETDEMVIKSPMKIDGTFEYPADHLKEDDLISDYTAECGFHYDESWFENSASTYQHDLARMSLRMTMTGLTRRDFDDATNTSHVEDLLTKLEFSNQVLRFPQPEMNTIGYCIGSKNLRSSSGEVYSLVAVVMRSSGYQDEWGGNLTIGLSGNHAGFQLAADQTVSAIRSYIGELTDRGQLTNKIKIWISGYSRGAAAANLAAASLNEQFGKENVFAYCFECPQGAVGSDVGGERYSNIFCIVNPIDLVPKLAMSVWGFTRYGRTFYLPAASNTANYCQLKAKMAREYAKHLSRNGGTNTALGVISITRELQTGSGQIEQSALFDRFVSVLARNVGSRNNYYWLHERYLAPAVADLMGYDNEVTTQDLIALLHLLTVEFIGLGTTPDELFGVEVLTLALMMKYAHYPELSVAWLDAVDGNTLCRQLARYRTVCVDGAADVSVCDAENGLVAQILNNKPQEIEGGVGAYLDENGRKVVVLPADMGYTVRVKAAENGAINYTVADFDLDQGVNTQVVSYSGLPVRKNETLVGTVPKQNGVTGDYTLTAEDGSVIAPDSEIQQSENPFRDVKQGSYYYDPVLWAVNHTPQITNGTGPRTFSPETTCTRGQAVTFLWRAEGCPEPKSANNPFTDVKEGAYYYKAVLWANENNITNGTGATTFSPESPCTRAHVVTFLWRTANKPAAGSSNPFKDVPSGQYYTDAVLWAVNHNPQITNGTGADTFSPDNPCTRGQIVTFLFRYMK